MRKSKEKIFSGMMEAKMKEMNKINKIWMKNQKRRMTVNLKTKFLRNNEKKN